MSDDESVKGEGWQHDCLDDPERVIVQTIVFREIMTTYERLDDVIAEAEAWTRAVFREADDLIAIRTNSLSIPADYEHRLDDDAGIPL